MSPTSKPASAKQLAYLKALAQRSGTTFTYPQRASDASREINRLRQLTPLSRDEQAIARRALDGDRERHTYATAPHRDEIAGWGSSATWR